MRLLSFVTAPTASSAAIPSQGITEIGRAAMVVDGKAVPQHVLDADQMASTHAVPHVNFYDPTVYTVCTRRMDKCQTAYQGPGFVHSRYDTH